MKINILSIALLFALNAYAHLCDNVFRQVDSLIVKPEMYSLVVRDSTTFKIFLQNNMDRPIAEISLIPESPAFNFTVTPEKMSIPRNRQVYFQVTVTPRANVRTGNYPVRFRLVGGGREFKSFTLSSLAEQKEQITPVTDKARLLQINPVKVPPVIDGNLNEPVWRTSAVISGFRSSSGTEPSYPVWALSAFDRQNVYFGLFVRTEDNIPVTERDSIEIILSPGENMSERYIITINPLGAPVLKMHRTTGEVLEWTPAGIRHSIMKGPNYWAVELAVPFSALGKTYPATSEIWDLRISRTKGDGERESIFWAADGSGAHNERGTGKIVMNP